MRPPLATRRSQPRPAPPPELRLRRSGAAIVLALTLAGAAVPAGTALGRPPAVAPGTGAWSIPTAHQASVLGSALDRRMNTVGSGAGAYVVDVTTGRVLYSRRSTVARIPASVQKLYTLSTVLLRFGVEGRLATSVYAAHAPAAGGVLHGNLYLRGSGDPTFGSPAFVRRNYAGHGATVTDLARGLIASTGLSHLQGHLVGDESFLDSRRGGPRTGYRYDSDVEGTLSGLAYDRGARARRGAAPARSPADFAASRFSATLRSSGVRVTERARTGRTPAHAVLLSRVLSPPMRILAAMTLGPSDNFFAELLLKDLGATFAGRGSTPTGAGVVRAQLATLGIHPRVIDGSGLSRNDRTSPRQVVTLLAKLRSLPIAPALIGALPVAGRSGTLARRMRGSAAQGRCQAKTGTLISVSSLAGYCRAANEHTLAFAFLMNSVNVGTAHAAQDAMASALARYNG